MDKENVLYLRGKGYSISDIQSILNEETPDEIQKIIKENLPNQLEISLNIISALERDVILELAEAKRRGRGDIKELMKMRLELLSKRVSLLEVFSVKKAEVKKSEKKKLSLDEWKK